LIVEAGGKLKYTDIPFPYPGPASPLGYEKFVLTIPDYPMDGGITAVTLRMMWDDWRDKINEAIKKLEGEMKSSFPKAKAYRDQVTANASLLNPYNNKVHKPMLF
jgi:hypothetical protein